MSLALNLILLKSQRVGQPMLQGMEKEESLEIEGEVFQSTKQGHRLGRSDFLYVLLFLYNKLFYKINVNKLACVFVSHGVQFAPKSTDYVDYHYSMKVCQI